VAASLCWTLPLLVLPACGGTSLKDFEGAALELDATEDGVVRVTLGDTSGGCKPLGGALRASLNGVNLSIDGLGGEIQTSAGWTCSRPTFSVPERAVAAMGSNLRLEVADGDTSVILEAQDVFAERTLALARPTRAGEDKAWRFLWRPQTDTARSAIWRLQSPEAPTLFGEAEIDDDTVRVELPEGISTGTLTVEGKAAANVTRCEGVAACTVRVRNTSGELRLSALY